MNRTELREKIRKLHSEAAFGEELGGITDKSMHLIDEYVAGVKQNIRAELIMQRKAAENNLKYQIENTGNKTLISEWTGAVRGIDFCLDALSRRAGIGENDA